MPVSDVCPKATGLQKRDIGKGPSLCVFWVLCLLNVGAFITFGITREITTLKTDFGTFNTDPQGALTTVETHAVQSLTYEYSSSGSVIEQRFSLGQEDASIQYNGFSAEGVTVESITVIDYGFLDYFDPGSDDTVAQHVDGVPCTLYEYPGNLTSRTAGMGEFVADFCTEYRDSCSKAGSNLANLQTANFVLNLLLFVGSLLILVMTTSGNYIDLGSFALVFQVRFSLPFISLFFNRTPLNP
jgi:YD repeat-containing protein